MASKRPVVSRYFCQRKSKRPSRPHLKSKVAAKPTTIKTRPVSEAEREHNILKEFDLTLEYGPCIGITRIERWERAEKHGLNPSSEVKVIISKHSDDETYTECLWNGYSTLK